jgi:hypothetical protein
MKPTLEFRGDDLYLVEPVVGYSDSATICRQTLVMTKDVFVACYNKWIKEEEDGTNDGISTERR